MDKAKETLHKFILRVRRIQAHSLVSDREKLMKLADPQLNIRLADDGTVKIRQEFPDEEIFESLAARVRPTVLPGESIYYEKVLSAIDSSLVKAEVSDIETLRLRLQQVGDFWSLHAEKNLSAVRYTTQAMRADGSETTPLASDSQLAMAWLYGDLVHVDVHREKKAGTHFPIKERYSAAVPYFATITVACLHTYALIAHLIERGILIMPKETLESPVSIGSEDHITTAKLYIGPTDTELPSLEEAIKGNIPEGFQQLTIDEMTRITEVDRAQVQWETSTGETLTTYDATVTRNHVEGKHHEIHVQISDIWTWKITFRLENERKVLQNLELAKEDSSTNKMLLEECRVSRNIARSAATNFKIPQIGSFRVPHEAASDDTVKELNIYVETLQDLVRIEEVSGLPISLLKHSLTPNERVRLRVSRLLWEGKVVPLTTSPISIIIDAETEPTVAGEQATISKIADIEVPRPAIYIWHPLMVADNVQPLPDSEPPKLSMKMIVPVEEPFIAWAPQLHKITTEDLDHLADWGLSHFDLSDFLGTWRFKDGLTESHTSN